MAESVKVIMSLKKAANYSKLAMRDFGPRSYKRGQGALLKVISRFGKDGVLSKDEAKKILSWRGCEVRAVAKKAERNGYVTIADPENGFSMSLTQLGAEIIQKRFAAEDKAAQAVLAGLTDEEQETLLALTQKISENCKGMGVDYDEIRKHRSAKKCCPEQSHGPECGHGHGHGPQNVFIFKGESHSHKHGHGPGKHNGHGAPRAE